VRLVAPDRLDRHCTQRAERFGQPRAIAGAVTLIVAADFVHGLVEPDQLPDAADRRAMKPAELFEQAGQGIGTGGRFRYQPQHPIDPQRAVGDMHEMEMTLLPLAVGHDHAGDMLERCGLGFRQTGPRAVIHHANETDPLAAGRQQLQMGQEARKGVPEGRGLGRESFVLGEVGHDRQSGAGCQDPIDLDKYGRLLQ
jgi:hypothetical protein